VSGGKNDASALVKKATGDLRIHNAVPGNGLFNANAEYFETFHGQVAKVAVV
jgi:hypothetical protein